MPGRSSRRRPLPPCQPRYGHHHEPKSPNRHPAPAAPPLPRPRPQHSEQSGPGACPPDRYGLGEPRRSSHLPAPPPDQRISPAAPLPPASPPHPCTLLPCKDFSPRPEPFPRSSLTADQPTSTPASGVIPEHWPTQLLLATAPLRSAHALAITKRIDWPKERGDAHHCELHHRMARLDPR